MSSSPAVILNNIPSSLRTNGQTVADVVLGSKTGKEMGVAFWKIHQSQPKFMIVFKHKDDRDRWIKTSPILKRFMMKHQVRITLIHYNRDRDLVIAEDEGVQRDPEWKLQPPKRGKTADMPKDSNNANVNTTRASDTSSINLSCLGAVFEDLDKLNVSQISNAEPIAKKTETIDVESVKSTLTATNEGTEKRGTGVFLAEATASTPGSTAASVASSPDTAVSRLAERLKIKTAPVGEAGDSSAPTLPDFLQPMSKLGLVASKKFSSTSYRTESDVDSPMKKLPHSRLTRSTLIDNNPKKSAKRDAVSSTKKYSNGPDTSIPPPGHPVDVSLPPPPLRLPLHVYPTENLTDLKSNILEKLATAAEKHFEGVTEERTALALVLKDSWIESREQLESLYEKVLGGQGFVSEDIGLELSAIYKFEGKGVLSRSKALFITKDFLSQSGKMVGADFNERFLKFLSDNPHYKVSNEEIDHIISRNGVDLFALFKTYSREQSVSTLRDKLRDQVNLGGQLFTEFSQILTDFFNLNLTSIRTRKPTSTSSSPSASPQKKVKTHQNSIQADLDRLQELISKKDSKNSSSVLKEVQGKVTRFFIETDEKNHEISTLKTDNLQLMKDLNSAKDDAKERMKISQQENKILRSRNSGLNDEAIDAKIKLAQAQTKLDFVCKTLDSLAVGEDVQFDLDVNDNEDANVIQKDLDGFMRSVIDLKSMYQGQGRGKHSQGNSRVNLITSEGKRMFVHTNRNNNIYVPELEKMIDNAVMGLRVPNLLGSGHTEFPARNGYIDSPQLGWINRDYEVKLL